MCLAADLLDRLVAPQRFQRHPGLEFRRKPASIRHLVFLRYPVEYTLAPCPIFWDHLNNPTSRTRYLPRTLEIVDFLRGCTLKRYFLRKTDDNEIDRLSCIQINLKSLEHNLKILQSEVGKRSVWPVIKANAYGHDAGIVGRHLIKLGYDTLCVARPSEAIALIDSGIHAKFLILSATLPDRRRGDSRSQFGSRDLHHPDVGCSKSRSNKG